MYLANSIKPPASSKIDFLTMLSIPETQFTPATHAVIYILAWAPPK